MSYVDRRRPPTARACAETDTVFARSNAVPNKRGAIMLHYAVVFFIIALIAAVFGFGGIAVGAAGIAKILFIVFLIGAVISFLMSLGRRV
jgi:uncharacterized membrane protein YtjA (UPF0391 family)